MRQKNITDPISFVREIARSAIWDAAYHQRELEVAYRHLAWAKELITRAGIDAGAEPTDVDDDGEQIITNLAEFALGVLADAQGTVNYHEERIGEGANNAAYAKALLRRGKYTEIDPAELEKEVELALGEKPP